VLKNRLIALFAISFGISAGAVYAADSAGVTACHYEGDWSYANRLDYFKRVITWFDGHLKTATPTQTHCEVVSWRQNRVAACSYSLMLS
jgi:hypothetical protein